ncbi:MAG: HAD family hydrolase [Desulfovibrionaceae bacterium]|nr:HAD family hydrolase [Desulfovibrionaceae bacterium]
MRLLATDFDGTLFRGRTISAEDMAAVRAWRARGNVFGIVTGRGAMTLMRELDRFPLEWDFLLCNNGALLLDERARAVAARPLARQVSRALLRHEIAGTATSTAVFDGLAMHVIEGGGKWVNPAYDPPFMPLAEALERDFVQVSFGFAERERAFDLGESLARELGPLARVQCSLAVADITAPEVGKDSGVEWACAIRGWRPEEIVAVGDDGNDVEMLERFGGWAMEGAEARVLAAAAGTTAGIAELVSTKYGCLQ